VTYPVRLQLSRAKGFNLQANSRAINGLPAVNVARPGKWGNPFRVGDAYDDGFIRFPAIDRAAAVKLYRDYWRRMLDDPGTVYVSAIESLTDLRGRNLACWCKPGEPCHVDVLLEIANG